MTTGDVTPLVGRLFVSTSNNVMQVTLIEAGALRFMWQRHASQADMDEAEQWVLGVLGEDHVISVCDDISKEAELLDAWRKL